MKQSSIPSGSGGGRLLNGTVGVVDICEDFIEDGDTAVVNSLDGSVVGDTVQCCSKWFITRLEHKWQLTLRS